MSERREDDEVAAVRVEFSRESLPDPVAANYFQFSANWPEVELLVGFIDLYDVHLLSQAAQAALERGEAKELTLPARISHRFFLSQRGLQGLRDQINELLTQLEQQKRIRQESRAEGLLRRKE